MSEARGITDGEVLRAILANAPVRVAVFDRSGRFLLDPDPNPPRASDDGAPAGGDLLELYGDVPGIREAVQRAFSGETTHLTRQRGGATYSTSFMPRKGASGEVDSVIAVATIITEDRTIERALAELQARERRLFNSSMIGLIYWDESGAITEANDTFLGIVGYTREDVARGRLDWLAMTPAEYRHLDEAGLVQVRERGSCVPFEKEYICKDGGRVQVLIGGSSWELGHAAGVAFVIDIYLSSPTLVDERRHKLAHRAPSKSRAERAALPAMCSRPHVKAGCAALQSRC